MLLPENIQYHSEHKLLMKPLGNTVSTEAPVQFQPIELRQ